VVIAELWVASAPDVLCQAITIASSARMEM